MNETRKQQRIVNRALRKIKNQLRTDAYLQNRFYINDFQKQRVTYEDGYVQWFWKFKFTDKISGDEKISHWYSINDFTWVNLANKPPQMPNRLFWELNDFIIRNLHEIHEKIT